jgi:hypothetical protein
LKKIKGWAPHVLALAAGLKEQAFAAVAAAVATFRADAES